MNKYEYGKNNPKQLQVFSGEHKSEEPTFVVERPGRFQFAPAASRPIRAMIPFGLIGKEIERSAQEGEDSSMLESSGPIRYGVRLKAKTRPADAKLIERARKFSKKALRRVSGVSRHAVDRFLVYEKVHPATRAKLENAVDKLERMNAGNVAYQDLK